MTNYSHSFAQRLARVNLRTARMATTAYEAFTPPAALVALLAAVEPRGCSVCDRTLGSLERELQDVLGRCLECSAPEHAHTPRLSWDVLVPRFGIAS